MKWNGWFALSQNNVANSFAPLNLGGRVNAVVGGIDYTTANRMILGVAVVGSRSDMSLNGTALNGTINSNGTTVAPYLAMPLNQSWSMNASIGTGRNTMNTNIANITGSQRSTTTLGSVGVMYRQATGKWGLTGLASLSGTSTKLNSYTDSAGNFIASGRVDAQQLTLGGQAAYSAGSVVPFVGLRYVYDLNKSNPLTLNGETAANDRAVWKVNAGLNFQSAGAVYGGIQVTTDQGKRQNKNDQIMFNVGVRF